MCVCSGRGFTLVEVLVVIGITGMLLGLGASMGLDAYRVYSFRAEQERVVSILEKARSRAINNIHQTVHGVCYQDFDYIIFEGVACVPGATSEHVQANKAIARASNFSTKFPVIIFSQLTGTTTMVQVRLTDGVRSEDMQVNYEGTIIW